MKTFTLKALDRNWKEHAITFKARSKSEVIFALNLMHDVVTFEFI